VRRLPIALILCVLLSGCAAGEGTAKKLPYTPLPYEREDKVAVIIGKSFVNVPVWTVEGALFITVMAMYFCAVMGVDPTAFRK
jgi:hypothetical protein